MYQVGDALTHAAFLAVLGGTHGYGGRVEAWYNGAKLEEVEFESGSVKVTSRNRERRSMDLVVAERLWPKLPTDLLSPYGVWLRAYATVAAGATTFPETAVFSGPLAKTGRSRWSGQIKVAAKDPFRRINREPFEVLRPAPAGTPIVAAIKILILEVYPAATVTDLTGSLALVPASTAWDARDNSRGTAIDDLAAAIGAEVYAQPNAVAPGGNFIIRPVPSPLDPIVWTLPNGTASIVENDEQEQSSDEVVNRWIVTSERTDAAPIRVVVTDDNSASPTRYGGPMGKLTKFYSSPLITSETQALAAGLAKLNRSIGLARTRTVGVPTNSAMEGGDVLYLGVDGETPESHIADEFTIPLTIKPPTMPITTRATGAD